MEDVAHRREELVAPRAPKLGRAGRGAQRRGEDGAVAPRRPALLARAREVWHGPFCRCIEASKARDCLNTGVVDCAILFNLVRVAARELRADMPFAALTAEMIKGKSQTSPKMKLKAAEGRHLLSIMHRRLQTLWSRESEHAQLCLQ